MRPLSRAYRLPEPGSKYHTCIKAPVKKVIVHLGSACSFSGLLQCWTNLPSGEKENKHDWHAIDVGSCHGTETFLVKAVNVDVGLLEKEARKGNDLDYGCT